jgi:branched-chain amino acid transport system substrate-binding protein
MAPNPEVARSFAEEWDSRGYPFAGRIEGQRGYDAMLSIVAAIEEAGTAEPGAIREALWNVEVQGVNGNIKFHPDGPEGAESGQNAANIFVVQVKDGEVVRPDFTDQ